MTQGKSFDEFRQAMLGYINRANGSMCELSLTNRSATSRIEVPNVLSAQRYPVWGPDGKPLQMQNPDGTFKEMDGYDRPAKV